MRINDTALKYIKSFLVIYLFVFCLLFLGAITFLLYRGYSNHSEQPSFILTKDEKNIVLQKDSNMSALITTLTRAEKQKVSLSTVATYDLESNPELTFDVYQLHSWTKFLGYSHIYSLRLIPSQNTSLGDYIYSFLMNDIHLLELFGTRSEETITVYVQKDKAKYDIILKDGIVIE